MDINPLKIGQVVGVESGRVSVLVSVRERTLVHRDKSYPIGQIGSYLTIPMDHLSLVAFVTGAAQIEHPTSKLDRSILIQAELLGECAAGRFTRGVNRYPAIGDDVFLAVPEDFAAILGSCDTDPQPDSTRPGTFSLGRFAFHQDFDVKVRGSTFFAKHAAVLGNTGSGKSCTTARILQEVVKLGESQVVLFDLHGEYRSAFCDSQGRLEPNVTYLGMEDLVLPYWLLKYEELEALFIDRSNPLNVSTQVSFLRSALLEFKQDAARALGLSETLTLDTPIYFSLDKLKNYGENLNEARFVLNDDHLAFSQLALRSLAPQEQQKLMREQRCRFNRGNPQGETPHPLYFGKLLGLIDQLDTKFNDRRYEFLLKPIEHGLGSRYFRDHLSRVEKIAQSSDLMNLLIRVLTGRVEPRSNLTIVDLSGIPFEIVDISVAVLTRLLFDLNFWTPAPQRHPLLIVFEEAHSYIPRVGQGRGFAKAAVERVAKEGRKYGVSAMLISQRPSELSETVLAQCGSFVVMRMSNPQDQHYVSKVVGDHFTGILQMVPVLRPGEAFVIGDSVLMPMRTLVTKPDPEPQSGDMDFFQHWASPSLESDLDDVIDHWRRQDRQRLGNATNEKEASPRPQSAIPPQRAQPASPSADRQSLIGHLQ